MRIIQINGKGMEHTLRFYREETYGKYMKKVFVLYQVNSGGLAAKRIALSAITGIRCFFSNSQGAEVRCHQKVKIFLLLGINFLAHIVNS